MPHKAAAGHGGTLALPPVGTNRSLYTDENPLGSVDFVAKIKLLADIDAYARAKDPRVRQVMASIAGTWQAVQILRPDGLRVADIRPLVRLNVAVMVGEGDRQESGSDGTGGRVSYAAFLDPATPPTGRQRRRGAAPGAGHLGSVPAPAGEMVVVRRCASKPWSMAAPIPIRCRKRSA